MNKDRVNELVEQIRAYVKDNLVLSQLSDEELEDRISDIVSERLAGNYVSIDEKIDIIEKVYSSIRGL